MDLEAPPVEHGWHPEPPHSSTTRGRRRRIVVLVTVAAVAGAAAGAMTGGLAGRLQVDGTACPRPIAPVETSLAAGDFTEVIASLRPSVVAVDVSRTRFDTAGLPVFEQMTGTGFAVDDDGHVVTNAHVVEHGGRITLTSAGGRALEAVVVGIDQQHDLAVIRTAGGALPAAPMGCSGDLEVGAAVVAIGNALALDGELSASMGNVAALDRAITTESGRSYTDLVQLDVAVNDGQSGGPLADAAGHVVGITTAAAVDSQGIGFAIGIDDALPVVEDITDRSAPEADSLGGARATTPPGGVLAPPLRAAAHSA